jgi:hypothetical protein
MTRGKRSKLHSAAGEKRIAAEEKGFRPLAHHGGPVVQPKPCIVGVAEVKRVIVNRGVTSRC